MPSHQSRRSRRLPWRFGLRGIFLFLFCVGIGLLCWKLLTVELSVYSLERSGWNVRRDGTDWEVTQDSRRHKVPSQLVSNLPQVGTIDYTGIDSCTPEDISALHSLPRLHTLSIASCDPSDRHFQALAQLTGLTELDLSGAVITAQRLKYVARLPELRRLVLRAAEIEPGALATLALSKKLESLDLSDTCLVNPDDLSGLGQLPALSHLEMRTIFFLGENLFSELAQIQALKTCDLRYSSEMDWSAYQRFLQRRPDVKVVIKDDDD